MKKKIKIILGMIVLITVLVLILPHIKLNIDNQILFIAYKDNIESLFSESCYDDGLFYNKKYNVTFTDIEFKKYWFIYIYNLKYEHGNLCDYEFIIEESYIINFIENAEIIENSNNINLKKLIEGKKAIIENKRYTGNNYDNVIYYKLDDKYNQISTFYYEELLIIQVGDGDEAKFIAYK